MNLDLEEIAKRNPTDKLPKWAQSHIKYLMSVIDAHQRSSSPHKESRITWGYGDNCAQMPSGNIPTGERVVFYESREKGSYISVRMDGENTLIINGSNSITIHPQGSNLIHVKLVNR